MIPILLDDGTKVVIYDDPINMPATLYKEFQKYLLQDIGIGASMEDVGARFAMFFQYVGASKYPEAKIEAENLYYAHYSIISSIDFKHLSFGCLIHSIGDKLLTDHSAANLTEVVAMLSDKGLTQKMVVESVEASKKNSKIN